MTFIIAIAFCLTLIALAMVTTSLGVWVRKTYGKFPTLIMALLLGIFATTNFIVYFDQLANLQTITERASHYEIIVRSVVNYGILISGIAASLGTIYLFLNSYFLTPKKARS